MPQLGANHNSSKSVKSAPVNVHGSRPRATPGSIITLVMFGGAEVRRQVELGETALAGMRRFLRIEWWCITSVTFLAIRQFLVTQEYLPSFPQLIVLRSGKFLITATYAAL